MTSELNKLSDKKLKILHRRENGKSEFFADGAGLSAKVFKIGGINWVFTYQLDGKKLNRLTMKKYNSYLFQLIVLHYIKASTLRTIGTKLGISHNEVSKRLQAAEGFIEGVLAVSGVTLELDKCVQKEVINQVA